MRSQAQRDAIAKATRVSAQRRTNAARNRNQPIPKTITRIERLNGSVNGNPAYELGFDDATSARTSSDASCAYEIGNPGYRVGDAVLVTFTDAGRIAYLHGHGSTFDTDRLLFQYAASQIDPDTTSADLEGPGRYDGCTDRVLAWSLETLHGVGGADEEAGSVDTGRHCARFGRYVLETDSYGFVDVFIHANEQDAIESLARVDAESIA